MTKEHNLQEYIDYIDYLDELGKKFETGEIKGICLNDLPEEEIIKCLGGTNDNNNIK